MYFTNKKKELDSKRGLRPGSRFGLRVGLGTAAWGRHMSGYTTSTNLPRVDGLSMDPRDLGRHIDSTMFVCNLVGLEMEL